MHTKIIPTLCLIVIAMLSGCFGSTSKPTAEPQQQDEPALDEVKTWTESYSLDTYGTIQTAGTYRNPTYITAPVAGGVSVDLYPNCVSFEMGGVEMVGITLDATWNDTETDEIFMLFYKTTKNFLQQFSGNSTGTSPLHYEADLTDTGEYLFVGILQAPSLAPSLSTMEDANVTVTIHYRGDSSPRLPMVHRCVPP